MHHLLSIHGIALVASIHDEMKNKHKARVAANVSAVGFTKRPRKLLEASVLE